jgi:hypothetical protein
MATGMPHAMDLGRVGKNAVGLITQDRVILPACLPQLVDDATAKPSALGEPQTETAPLPMPFSWMLSFLVFFQLTAVRSSRNFALNSSISRSSSLHSARHSDLMALISTSVGFPNETYDGVSSSCSEKISTSNTFAIACNMNPGQPLGIHLVKHSANGIRIKSRDTQ